MARDARRTQSRLAQLGFFVIVAIVLLAAGIYVVSNAGPGRGHYRMGVRFASASGLGPGSIVYLSGVNIGTVNKISILPDGTVEVILGIRGDTDIPKHSKFGIVSSVTGSPTIAIAPPRLKARPGASPTPLPGSEILPKRVLPIAQQPVGTAPVTIQQFVGESKSLMGRAQAVMSGLHGRKSALLGALQSSRSNALAAKAELGSTIAGLQAKLDATLVEAKRNLTDASIALRRRDRAKIAVLANAFLRTADSAQATLAGLQSALRDPRAKANLRESAKQLQQITSNMSAVSADMAAVTGNPQTRAELRDAGARLRAVVQKIKSLL